MRMIILINALQMFHLYANSNAWPIVNVMSEANLLDMKTKHSCVSSPRSDESFGTLFWLFLAMKLKKKQQNVMINCHMYG